MSLASLSPIAPFCGTGTTLVEAKLCGVPSIGLEANPFTHFASFVKVDCSVDPDTFIEGAQKNSCCCSKKTERTRDNQTLNEAIKTHSLRTLDPDAANLLLSNSISSMLQRAQRREPEI